MYMKGILKFLNSWLDIYRKPDENLLSAWFTRLYELMQNEEKKGNTSEKIWYQKEGEMDITDIPNELPLYKVKTLVLLQTVKDRKKYYPQISEVTLISDVIPAGTAEIQTWRLNLSLFNDKGKNAWPEIIFSRFQYSQLSDNQGKLEISQKHEINFTESRDLTLYEVKFIKSIFDKALY